MMIELIKKKNQELIDLRQREERIANIAKQEAVDHKFSDVTCQIHEMVVALKCAKDATGFQLQNETLDAIKLLLDQHKQSIKDGYAEKEVVIKTEADVKAIQITVKKEWTTFYKQLTGATVATLKVIRGINSHAVSKCLDGISNAEGWSNSSDTFNNLSKSLSIAQNLIDDLGLDQDIISFLQKMNSGKARLADISSNVWDWLKKEELDSRVHLSFVNVVKS